MTNQDDIISMLEIRINQVIRVAEGFKSDKDNLKQQVDDLLGKLYAKNKEIEVLESKYQSLKLAKTITLSSDDVNNARLQISRMVREIDKCVALLNK